MRGDKWICNLAQMIDYAYQVRADNTVDIQVNLEQMLDCTSKFRADYI